MNFHKLIRVAIIAALFLNTPLFAVSITCAGGDTMIPIMEAWASAVHQKNPRYSINIDHSKKLSAEGFDEFINGSIDCVTFVREPFESEIKRYTQKYGHPPFLIPVAGGSYSEKSKTHALAVYINTQNPLNHIDLQQLDAIFSSTLHRGHPNPIRKWGDLGIKGEYADKDIRVYGMLLNRESGNPPGIVNYLKRKILAEGNFQNKWIEVKDEPNRGALDLISEKISHDPYSIGISGFGNSLPNIKSIAISNGYESPVSGTLETVKDQTYPLSRRIYLMLRTDSNLQLSDIQIELLGEIFSEGGQNIIQSKSNGFLLLPRKQIQVLKSSLACDARLPLYHQGSISYSSNTVKVSDQGKIRIIGYNDMKEIIDRWNQLFFVYNPELIFETKLKGTRTAPWGLISKESLYAPMGAPFEEDALKTYNSIYKHNPIMFNVAHNSLSPAALSGPIAIFTNKESALNEVSLNQLAEIYSNNSESKFNLYGMNEDTALGKFMLEKLSISQNKFPKSMLRFRQSRDLVSALANDQNGLGFASAQIQNSAIKKLSIAVNTESPAISLNENSIKDGLYPLDRKLLIYVNANEDGQISPLAKNYLEFVLSCAGQNLVEDSIKHYLPLNSNEISAERAKLSQPPL